MMNLNLLGKRLLVLGGSNNALDIRRYCDETGVILLAAGRPVAGRMAEVADETFEADIYNEEEVLNVTIKSKADGIFVCGNENVISCVINVTQKLNLPFYADRGVWDCVMNKRFFKQTCKTHGVPTMEDYFIDESNLELSASKLEYPVVIKPVDNCGSNGVMKCETASDFPMLYMFAKENSRTRQVTVENFIDGFEIVVYYTFCDGNVSLSSMGDKYVRGDSNNFIPLSEIYAYPSQYLTKYIQEVDTNMRSMLLDMGIRNGITSMQGFVSDGKFYFFEMGYRLGGTAQYRYTEHINGINSFFMMMNLALTGQMSGYDQSLDNAEFHKPCCTLTLMSKGGTIAKIEGIDEAKLLPEVIYLENRYNVGETIKNTRTVSQFHIRLFLVANTVCRMREVINYLQDVIRVYDINGESMLITHFDTNKLVFNSQLFQ